MRASAQSLMAAGEAFHRNEEFRLRAETDPHGALAEKGFEMPPGYEVRIVANTKDTFWLALPPDPNIDLSDEDLAMVAGGKSASSAGSAGTASTLSTVPSTVSTAGTLSSAGTAGTSS